MEFSEFPDMLSDLAKPLARDAIEEQQASDKQSTHSLVSHSGHSGDLTYQSPKEWSVAAQALRGELCALLHAANESGFAPGVVSVAHRSILQKQSGDSRIRARPEIALTRDGRNPALADRASASA